MENKNIIELCNDVIYEMLDFQLFLNNHNNNKNCIFNEMVIKLVDVAWALGLEIDKKLDIVTWTLSEVDTLISNSKIKKTAFEEMVDKDFYVWNYSFDKNYFKLYLSKENSILYCEHSTKIYLNEKIIQKLEELNEEIDYFLDNIEEFNNSLNDKKEEQA